MSIPLPNEVSDIISSISGVAGVLSSRGWAEAGAGNISVNVTDFFKDQVPGMDAWKILDAGVPWNSLKPAILLITNKGTRMRQLACGPADYLCFVATSPGDKLVRYAAVNQVTGSYQPSSELATHLMLQEWMVQYKPQWKTILHTHPTQLIALSHIIGPENKEVLNNLLWGMHTETVVFIPDGLGFAGFREPGSYDLARDTLKEMEVHQLVLWEKHGCIAIAGDPDEALDLVEIAAKAAEVYLLTKASGHQAAGLTASQLERLRKLNLPK